MLIPRSLLFVPGNRPERFEKALNSGADLVCIDLEDAVAPDAKADARDAVIAFLKQCRADHVSLRINGPGTADCAADMVAISGLTLPFVMIPKVDTLDELNTITSDAPLIPVIESGLAMLNAAAILSDRRVRMGLFGGGDYAADLGVPMTFEAFHYARSHLAACAAAFEKPIFDVPYLDVHDVAGGEADTRRVADLGIHCRAAIHPKQIDAIHAAYTPSDDDIEKARSLRDAYAAAEGNAALHDGKLIEAPILRAAERVLARAGLL
ncbi:HpcH/HpaI aldolase/citrate lyase family protein [Algimonas porphyrae]|uniref:CoA ester lyase n=1 Tax=Algimonas porphyrae TaxID=1128113 RepID=A0ABQ5UXK5_9PROT|nr:CoA ester lyase [Algimonas porphyrae]GLQ20021.1 CoA ester lyase [Algimonas porphyrae]